MTRNRYPTLKEMPRTPIVPSFETPSIFTFAGDLDKVGLSNMSRGATYRPQSVRAIRPANEVVELIAAVRAMPARSTAVRTSKGALDCVRKMAATSQLPATRAAAPPPTRAATKDVARLTPLCQPTGSSGEPARRMLRNLFARTRQFFRKPFVSAERPPREPCRITRAHVLRCFVSRGIRSIFVAGRSGCAPGERL